MSGGAMQKCPDDHPLMIAWNDYQKTDDFNNNFGWATKAILISTRETAPEANRVDPIVARQQRAMGTLWGAFMAGFNAATERAASLHEQVNPASDDERNNSVPGAGGMGAVIQYRDLIRATR